MSHTLSPASFSAHHTTDNPPRNGKQADIAGDDDICKCCHAVACYARNSWLIAAGQHDAFRCKEGWFERYSISYHPSQSFARITLPGGKYSFVMRSQNPARLILYGLPMLAVLLSLLATELRFMAGIARPVSASPASIGAVGQAFERAGQEFHVPSALLEAICYMEGRLSMNGGRPSVDNGFGCMHLVQNSSGDPLDRAAREMGANASQLKLDMPTNIRGGAALLRDYALQLASTHQLPGNLSDWYGAVAAYGNATTRATDLMYADAVYQILDQGFSAVADDGETITLPPQSVRPNTVTASAVQGSNRLPSSCKRDQQVDYPGAVDCLVPASTFDCNQTPKKAPCNYEGAQRPADYAIDMIVIHDIEGTVQSALSVFQNPKTQASAHYIVGTDGTVFQVVRERDIAYHAGNYWYNQHSIGIEHSGYDATGYRWYSAAEYLASAKLTAYLLKKYNLPLNHARIVSHGTVPSPSATSLPNHVDPGPYWLWDYYFKLVQKQDVPDPPQATDAHIFTLHPKSAQQPFGKKGKESSANFNFFYLYNGPSTASGRIPQEGSGHDITDVSGCVEPDISYYYLSKVADTAGSGDTMYKIWYGVEDQMHKAKPSRYAHARLAWLAVPRGAVSAGEGIPVTLHATNGKKILVYGQPTTGKGEIIGSAPEGAIFVSAYTVIEDGTATGNQNGGNGDNDNGNSGNQDNNNDDNSNGNSGNQSGSGDTGNTGDQNGNNGTGNMGNTGNQNSGDTTGDTGNTGDQNGSASTSPVSNTGPTGNTGATGNADGSGNLWYEINYNHRQGWVPASEVSLPPPAAG